NMPEDVTVDDVAQLIADAWRLGVKAIAIYRDNCKVAQPLSGKADGAQVSATPPTPLTQRRRLPEDRTEIGRKFRVGEYEGYIHVGLYEDGSPADIFVDYIFRWCGKKFLTPEQQEEAGILSPEVKARLAERYNGGADAPAAPVEAPPPGQTALFNSWEDAVECAKCGGRMVRTGSCYTCRDCGTNTGCS